MSTARTADRQNSATDSVPRLELPPSPLPSSLPDFSDHEMDEHVAALLSLSVERKKQSSAAGDRPQSSPQGSPHSSKQRNVSFAVDMPDTPSSPIVADAASAGGFDYDDDVPMFMDDGGGGDHDEDMPMFMDDGGVPDSDTDVPLIANGRVSDFGSDVSSVTTFSDDDDHLGDKDVDVNDDPPLFIDDMGYAQPDDADYKSDDMHDTGDHSIDAAAGDTDACSTNEDDSLDTHVKTAALHSSTRQKTERKADPVVTVTEQESTLAASVRYPPAADMDQDMSTAWKVLENGARDSVIRVQEAAKRAEAYTKAQERIRMVLDSPNDVEDSAAEMQVRLEATVADYRVSLALQWRKSASCYSTSTPE